MIKNPGFFLKQIERVAYIMLLFSLVIGRLVALFFFKFPFLLKKNKPVKDLLLFPFSHKDNIGTIARFQIFLPLLERDKFTYDIYYTWNKQQEDEIYFKSKSRTLEYFYLGVLFWRRLFQTMRAGNYRAVFFQKSMYPLYYDQFTPYLEKLICKINDNVTVDYFDADYMHNSKLINTIAKTTNKVSVVNEHLKNYFEKLNAHVFYNDLALNIKSYKIKNNYSINEKINFFWTGSESNAINLREIIPILEKLNTLYPLQLTMICRSNAGYNNPIINNTAWNEKTFFQLLSEADIAIYPALEDTEFTRGKVAYKNIEYGAAALPIIASLHGLSPHFENETDVLLATNAEEWEKQILRLINDESLRKKLGTNARLKTEKFHSLELTYKNLLENLLGTNPTPLKE